VLLLVIGPAVPLGCQAQGLPAGPPFASGAALRVPTACEWATDISGHHPIGPGLAGGADSPAQASAAACEKWCCETSHMKTVDHKPGDAPWKFTEEPGGEVARQCEFWAWKEAPANDAWTKGCWVAGADFVPGEVNPPCPACGKGNAVDPTWLGAQKCLDPGVSACGNASQAKPRQIARSTVQARPGQAWRLLRYSCSTHRRVPWHLTVLCCGTCAPPLGEFGAGLTTARRAAESNLRCLLACVLACRGRHGEALSCCS
jgi:hypothetical protein